MSEPTNEDRAKCARATLIYYDEVKNGHTSDEDSMDEDDITDLLADLMHYCKLNDIVFDDKLSSATDHFSHEIG